MPKIISVLLPSFNESENVDELYSRLCSTLDSLPYQFEFLFIDNASTDDTVKKLKLLAEKDRRVKIIINTRNFGHIRSPYWGLLQTSGDASIAMASDLQDPPELIPEFIKQWEMGWKVVLGVKPISQTNFLMSRLRKLYYRILDSIANVHIVKDTTGFGLYDKKILNHIRDIADPYPYFRGMVSELGYPVKTIPFLQPRRERGLSKSNFYILFDLGMLGVISHSMIPIRVMTFAGIILSLISFCIAIFYIVMKLIDWNGFALGIAPITIGLYLMFGLLFIFIGILGEYIASIYTYVRKRPIVVESERINFESQSVKD